MHNHLMAVLALAARSGIALQAEPSESPDCSHCRYRRAAIFIDLVARCQLIYKQQRHPKVALLSSRKAVIYSMPFCLSKLTMVEPSSAGLRV